MICELLVTRDWEGVVARFGGAGALEQSARDTKAFLRARAVATQGCLVLNGGAAVGG